MKISTLTLGAKWRRSLAGCVMTGVLCVYTLGAIASTDQPMSLSPVLSHDQSDQALAAPQDFAQAQDTQDAISPPLRLEHMLSSLERLIDPHRSPTGGLAQTPSARSILKFIYWFALILLVSLTARDALRLFQHLLLPPPAPRPAMPYAPWPTVTVVFESQAAWRLAQNITALNAADYPADRLKIIVLCPMHEATVFTAIQKATASMPGRIIALPCNGAGDLAGRCFSAGIRFGTGELVLVLSDTLPCLPNSIKACAERFFDPSLGALLGFVPGALADDKALAPRIANLLRMASHTAGMTASAGMTPGTGLLALRRSAMRTAGMDPSHATDCFALLRQLERFGSHHALQDGITAAGEAIHNWEGRSRWISDCARAYAATMPLNPFQLLTRRHAMPINFGMQGKLLLPILWGVVAMGSVVLYFTGNALAAATGLGVCTATAYGVDRMPSAFNCTAILFRVHGRRAEASLVAWAPVVFCHDISIALSSAAWTLCQRAMGRKPSQIIAHSAPQTLSQPIEQSTLA